MICAAAVPPSFGRPAHWQPNPDATLSGDPRVLPAGQDVTGFAWLVHGRPASLGRCRARLSSSWASVRETRRPFATSATYVRRRDASVSREGRAPPRPTRAHHASRRSPFPKGDASLHGRAAPLRGGREPIMRPGAATSRKERPLSTRATPLRGRREPIVQPWPSHPERRCISAREGHTPPRRTRAHYASRVLPSR
jgi:hypothetical protein